MLRERSPGLANASRSNPMAEPRFVEAIGVLRLGRATAVRPRLGRQAWRAGRIRSRHLGNYARHQLGQSANTSERDVGRRGATRRFARANSLRQSAVVARWKLADARGMPHAR